MTGFSEAVRRIAERISDHNILDPYELWRCKCCGKQGQGMENYANHVALEIAMELGITEELQWVPTRDDGTELAPAENFSQAEYIFKTVKDVNRVDREYRFVSRWFRPSRDG